MTFIEQIKAKRAERRDASYALMRASLDYDKAFTEGDDIAAKAAAVTMHAARGRVGIIDQELLEIETRP